MHGLTRGHQAENCTDTATDTLLYPDVGQQAWLCERVLRLRSPGHNTKPKKVVGGEALLCRGVLKGGSNASKPTGPWVGQERTAAERGADSAAVIA